MNNKILKVLFEKGRNIRVNNELRRALDSRDNVAKQFLDADLGHILGQRLQDMRAKQVRSRAFLIASANVAPPHAF